MRLSDLVACDCLALITFSDPDQARQIAASDRSLQCLQDSDILLLLYLKPKVTLHFELSNISLLFFEFNQIKYCNELLVPALS